MKSKDVTDKTVIDVSTALLAVNDQSQKVKDVEAGLTSLLAAIDKYII